jgi:prophage regulatory protein
VDDRINIIKLSEVIARTGLSRSTIYRRVKQTDFPKPIPLGGNSIGWIEMEVQQWLLARMEDRRSYTQQ